MGFVMCLLGSFYGRSIVKKIDCEKNNFSAGFDDKTPKTGDG